MNKILGAAIICSMSITLPSVAQDIKPLDYSSKFKQQQVRERDTYEVKYQGNQAVDSVLLGKTFFDQSGRMSKYIEYFMKGRKMAEYDYVYDEAGRIVSSTVKLVFNDWQPLTFDLRHDTNGRLIERSLPEPVANFWQKETYQYSSSGILIKSEQWYPLNGQLVAQSKKEYPSTIQPQDNSVTYIHDQNGLMLVHQLFGSSGKADKALVYSYTRF